MDAFCHPVCIGHVLVSFFAENGSWQCVHITPPAPHHWIAPLCRLVARPEINLNHFPQKLKKQYPSLDATDIRYCCLYLLGLNEAQIAALVQRSYQSVWTRAKEMKTFFGSDGIGNALINLLWTYWNTTVYKNLLIIAYKLFSNTYLTDK